jgi:hypothetical protein
MSEQSEDDGVVVFFLSMLFVLLFIYVQQGDVQGGRGGVEQRRVGEVLDIFAF